MMWKRFVAVSGLTWAFAATGPAWTAEEPTKPPEEPAPPQATQTEEPKKPGFWGDRLALYLEVEGGSATPEDVNPSLITTVTDVTDTTLAIDDATFGRLVAGWMLPQDRGSFRLVLTGYKENAYTLHAAGLRTDLQAAPPVGFLVGLVPWWTLDINDGHLVGRLNPPLWSPADDANGNGRADREEVHFNPFNPCNKNPGDPNCRPEQLETDAIVPDNAQNRLQTLDLLYQRDFGGRAWSARWTAGLRRLVYQGNIPATAWLLTSPSSPGVGFTDGTTLRVLSFNQDTTGIGPTGSLELQRHLFRRRLTLFGEARFAFLLQSLESDTGQFFTLVRRESIEIVAPARLETTVDKSAWQFGVELGARVRLAEGLHAEVAYNRTSYQDVLLLPFSITIPTSSQEVVQGTVGLYSTRDLLFDSFHLGIGYQF